MRRTIASSSSPFYGVTLTVRRMEEARDRKRMEDVSPKWNEVAITIKLKTKDNHRDLIRMRVADCSPLNIDTDLSMWKASLERELKKIGKREKLEVDYLVEVPPDDPSGLNRRFREFAEAVARCKHVNFDG